MDQSIRTQLLERVIFPTATTILSSIIIGVVLSVVVDGKMERWKTLSTLQITREKEAHIRLYDAYAAASNAVFNYEEGFDTSREKVDDRMDAYLAEYNAQSVYLPDELSETYVFMHNTLLVAECLTRKEERTEEDNKQLDAAMDKVTEANDVLRGYMKLWHVGDERRCLDGVHAFYQKTVKPGAQRADEYSSELLRAEAEATAAVAQ